MVLPLIPIAIVGAGALIGAGAGVGLALQDPDVTQQKTISTTNQFQTKKTNLTLKEGARIESLTFGGSMSQGASTEQTPTQSTSEGINPLFLVAGAGVAYYLLQGGKN